MSPSAICVARSYNRQMKECKNDSLDRPVQ
jgi:hypothetical protein